jgi:hypothetical protein
VKLLFIFLWSSFSVLAMEERITIKPSEVLASENSDENSPIGIDLKMAFDFAMQELCNNKEYKTYFAPSNKALKDYAELHRTQYQSVEKKICRHNLTEHEEREGRIDVCPFAHCILAAYYSATRYAVESIWKNGFLPSAENKSMGGGVYFTTDKIKVQGKYIIACIVMVHDGRKIMTSLLTEDSQKWQANIDIKYTFFGDNNVVKEPEKIIPLGIIYHKNLKNPLLKD